MHTPGCGPGQHLGLEVGGHCSACGRRVDDANLRWLGLLVIAASTVLVVSLIVASIWWLWG